MEKVEIKESLELIKAVEIIGIAGKKSFPEGKFTAASALSASLELIKEIEPVIEGFKGLNKIDEEVKELEQDELIQLGLALFNAYKSVKNA